MLISLPLSPCCFSLSLFWEALLSSQMNYVWVCGWKPCPPHVSNVWFVALLSWQPLSLFRLSAACSPYNTTLPLSREGDCGENPWILSGNVLAHVCSETLPVCVCVCVISAPTLRWKTLVCMSFSPNIANRFISEMLCGCERTTNVLSLLPPPPKKKL